MIPPEPDPDPPTPTIPQYAYSYVEDILIEGNFPGKWYAYMREGDGTDPLKPAGIDGTFGGNSRRFRGLLIYEGVDSNLYYGFTYGGYSTDLYVILANNSEMGQTNTLYHLVNGSFDSQTQITVYLDDSVPSEYYEDIKSGLFTLVKYETSKGDRNESEQHDN